MALSMILLFLLCTVISISTANGQCTFQGSLHKRGDPAQHYADEAAEWQGRFVRRDRDDALSPFDLENRAACNADNLLRALRANAAAATPFCRTFIGIGTITKTTSPPGVTATVVSYTVGEGLSYFPGGTKIESIPIPTFVETYPASRISSGCSCLSAPSATTTVTLTSGTNYFTVTSTYTATVSGACATPTPYLGGFELGSADPNVTVGAGYGNNAYDCCFYCNVIPETNNCLAWVSTPGSCLFLKGPFQYLGPPCPQGLKNGAVGVNVAKHPNNFGGNGPCAGTITVCQE
ncbi:MAG: hypothetical protein M1824_000745 [Vezdaea acicularis]|nr:MAG: hypothetical protein M1824_000745 [Vezdaea acicularis]